MGHLRLPARERRGLWKKKKKVDLFYEKEGEKSRRGVTKES